jgi:predicted Zn-dependent peptidase
MVNVKETKIINDFEKGPIRRSLFDNGAVTLFHHVKNRKVAVVNLYFLAGSIFENEKEYGIAHVLEHMLFKESKDSNIIRELEFLGADINAYTSKEYVCFELTCIATKLDTFLEKFLTLFLNPTFNLNELILEKNVIVQELKEDKDDHETEAIEYVFKKNFDAKIGHSIGGSIKNVKSFKKDEILNYYNKYFKPNRMILSIASGKNSTKIDSICSKVFNDEKFIKPVRLGSSKKIGKLNHFNSKLKRKKENSIVMFSFNGLSLSHESYYDLLVLDELLFEGLSSKLFILLREELGLIYSLGSSLNSFVKTGCYLMVFNTSPKNVKALKTAVKRVLEFCTEEHFDNDEVDLIKSRIIDGWEISFDDPSEICDYIALEEIYGTNELSIAKMRERINRVDPKSIRKLSKKIFDCKFSELVVGP